MFSSPPTAAIHGNNINYHHAVTHKGLDVTSNPHIHYGALTPGHEATSPHHGMPQVLNNQLRYRGDFYSANRSLCARHSRKPFLGSWSAWLWRANRTGNVSSSVDETAHKPNHDLPLDRPKSSPRKTEAVW